MVQDEYRQLGYRGGTFAARMRGFFFKALVLVASVLLLIGAIAVSIVLFAIALTALAVFLGFLWWKTRQLRRRLREQAANAQAIEGEVVRSSRREDVPRR